MFLTGIIARLVLLTQASPLHELQDVNSGKDALSMLQMETRTLPAELENKPSLNHPDTLPETLPEHPAASQDFVQLCRDNPAEYIEENKTEAILHVVMESHNLDLWSFRLLDAMNKANLKVNEWEVVGAPYDTHSILANDSLPQIYNVTIRKTSQYKNMGEGIESEEEHIVYEKAVEEEEQTVHEMVEHLRHPLAGEHKIPNSSDAMSIVTVGSDGTITTPDESASTAAATPMYEVNYDKIHGITTWDDVAAEIKAQGGMNTENLGRITLPPGVDLGEELIVSDRQMLSVNESNDLSLLRGQRRRRRGQKKNKRQKEWVSKALGKLEGEMCSRTIHGKPVARGRSSRALSCDWRRRRRWWPSLHCHCSGWENIALICYRPCDRGWYGIWFLCHKSCAPWEDTLSTCNKRCNDGTGQKFWSTCGLGYCSINAGACVAFVAKIAVAFLEMLSNFIPGTAAMNKLRGIATVLVKSGMNAAKKMALKAAVKAAVRDVKKRLLKEAKKNLKKYMKQQRRELREELQDSLLEGGAETVSETMIAKTETGALKDAAMEMVKAVDPTGITGVVDAFEASSCDSKYIDDMPEQDLDGAVCPDEINIQGYTPEHPLVLGAWEMMDDEYDGRPVYQNQHDFYIYSLYSRWHISTVVGAVSVMATIKYSGDCPPFGFSINADFYNARAKRWVTRTTIWRITSPRRRRRAPPTRRRRRR
jgi:hypothetical protein